METAIPIIGPSWSGFLDSRPTEDAVGPDFAPPVRRPATSPLLSSPGLLLGVPAAVYAASKGRNIAGWGAGGAIAGLAGGLLVVGLLNAEKSGDFRIADREAREAYLESSGRDLTDIADDFRAAFDRDGDRAISTRYSQADPRASETSVATSAAWRVPNMVIGSHTDTEYEEWSTLPFFRSADSNKDGSVSEPELRDSLASFDADNNGRLNKTERGELFRKVGPEPLYNLPDFVSGYRTPRFAGDGSEVGEPIRVPGPWG